MQNRKFDLRFNPEITLAGRRPCRTSKCPDLITGIHGDDPREVYADLCDVVAEVIENLQSRGRPLPEPHVRPMREVI